MRAFIAIDLDEPVKRNLLELIQQLQKATRNVKWVARQGLHLTLKFLGEISEEESREVMIVLERVSSRHHTFPLRVKGTGQFPPNTKSPRVLWVGVEDEPNLLALQEDLEVELAKMGFARESREFHPHLTLGRVKVASGLDSALRELELKKGILFGEMTVRKITLFRSVLKPDGAEYSILAEEELH
jgi:2'-5' RNA ligase